MKMRDKFFFGAALIFWAILLAIEVAWDAFKIKLRKWKLWIVFHIYMIAMWISTRIPPM